MTILASTRLIGIVALLALGELTCRRSKTTAALPMRDPAAVPPSTAPKPPPKHAERVPMSTPTFQGPQAISFSSEFASSLRNSQVHVKRKRFASWSRHAIRYDPTDPRPVPERTPPFLLVVGPDGHHGVLSYARAWNDLLDDEGLASRAIYGDVVALADRVFLAGQALSWDQKQPFDENSFGIVASVRRIDDQRFAAVAAYPPPRGDRPWQPALGIQGGSRTRGATGSDWIALIEGSGIAAIAADFTSVIAHADGRLLIYPPIADARGEAHLGAERHVGGAAKFISIVGPHIMLIVPDTTGGHLLAFTGDTTPVYSLPLPFEVLQPAIAGAKGRVYLAGKGLAALDHGKLTWSHLSEEPIYVSTFEDGSLAIATGKRLDLVKTNGSIDQTFNAEEPLVAPPAIASDGSIWAASATALYIAR